MITFVPEPAGAETFYSAILFRNRSPGGQKRVHAVGTWFRNTPQPFSYIPVRWRAILDRKWRDQTEERSDPFCPGQNEQDLPVQIGREPHSAFVTAPDGKMISFFPLPKNKFDSNLMFKLLEYTASRRKPKTEFRVPTAPWFSHLRSGLR